ncbi:MAG: hypothetical protein C4543_06240 [Ignavibacteriales bacterium]|jgi:hypothetical protein|nr:MAG: hypothetical protein C4543_06240 [Ignavibacteriales bacterium]
MLKKFFFVLPILLLLLTSCLNYTQITTIKTDGSGEMFVHYWMKWEDKKDSVLLNKLHIFNADSIRNEFSSPHNTIERINTFINYADSTIHAQVELEYNNFDSLKFTRAFKGANFSLVDGPNETKIFSQYLLPFATGFGLKPDDFKISLIYYLPGEILSHNAKSKSRNKLTWDYSLSEIRSGEKISATYRPFRLKETPQWVYFSSLLVILIVLYYLFRKRK